MSAVKINNKLWKSMSPEQQRSIIAARKSKGLVLQSSGKQKKNGVTGLKKVKKVRKSVDISIPAATSPFGNLQQPRGVHNVQIVPIAPSPTQKKVLNVNASLAPTTVNCAFLSLASFLAIKNVFNDSLTTGLGNPALVVYPGLAWCMRGVNSIAVGGSQLLAQAPQVVVDLLNALKPKEVGFHTSFKVSYGWNQFNPDEPLLPLNVGDGVYALTYADISVTDTGVYNTTLQVLPSVNGTEEQYAAFLRVVGNLVNGKNLKIVAADGKNKLSRDVSTFARSYRYVGLSPTPTNGIYKDVENEVSITCPMYSAFCAYITPDVRVPRKLTTAAGGANFTMWPLHDLFVSHFNKVNPVIKQIDFEEIYCLMCEIAVKAKTQAQTFGSINPIFWQPFPFSQQDFRIMLRQALLTLYQDSQYMTQFESYTQYDSNTNSFVPFLVTPGTAARTTFQKMLLPTLVSENLNSLRARALKIGNKSSKLNVATWMPTLGRYWEDTPVEFQYPLGPVGGPIVMTPLFNTTLVQTFIRLTDMQTSTPLGPVYVDPNCAYYQGVMSDWNDWLTGLQSILSQTRPIIIDSGSPGMGLNFVTKIQEKDPNEDLVVVQEKKGAKKPIGRYYKPMEMSCVINGSRKLVERQNSKEKLGPLVIPEADLTQLCNMTLVSSIPLTSEEEVFLQTIITPTVRLNDTEDALTLPMYQTITSEAASSPLSTVAAGDGIGVFSDIATYAGICVTGGGKDQTNDYIEMMKTLQSRAHAGMLAGLIGGIVKGFAPGLSGAVDVISSIVPF